MKSLSFKCDLRHGCTPLDSVPTPILICDDALNMVFANLSAKTVFKKIAPLLKTRFNVKWKDFLVGSIHRFHADPKRVEKILKDPANFPYKTIFSLGEVQLDAIINRICGEDGKLQGYLAELHPVSDERRLEHFRAFLDFSRDSVFVVDNVSGRVLDANAKAWEKLGYCRQELLRLHVYDFVKKYGDAKTFQQKGTAALRKSGRIHLYGDHVRKDGTAFPTDTTVNLVKVHGKEFAFANVKDLSETAKSQGELTLFRALMEHSPDPILISDPKTAKFIDVNETACRVFGYTRSEFLGLRVPAINKNVPLSIWDDLAAKIRAEKNVTIDGRSVRKDGSIYPSEVTVSYVAGGRKEYFVAFVRDVTARRKTEDSLREAEERARLYARRLSDVREEERAAIARDVHDELGQSLVALKMEFAHCVDQLPAEMTHMRKSAASMVGLIDRTIAETRRITTELRPLVLDDLGLVAAVEWQNQEFQKHTGIRCTLSHVKGLDLDGARSTAVFRIFQEALTNIARHANATRVRTSLHMAGDCLVLEVCDNGRGIKKVAAAESGHFGLWGMRERASAWGGTIEVAAVRKGSGTRVRLNLPLKTPEGESAG